jgi:predicted Zn-dependent peptidase
MTTPLDKVGGPAVTDDLGLRRDGVRQIEVDGLAVLLADQEGPMTAGLTFRVGVADEEMTTSGLTHLIEHLAHHGHSTGIETHNGQTGELFTHFVVTGEEHEVAKYLTAVCASLRELPLDRIPGEKRVLAVEAASRPLGALRLQAAERFGTRGPGSGVYGELGLHHVDEAVVQDWANTWFTSDNAVLWINRPTLPPGIDLRLPRGTRKSVPVWAEVPGPRPGSFPGPAGGVVLDAIVPRGPIAFVFAAVMRLLLFRELRTTAGLSYSPTCDYSPIGGDRVRISILADTIPDAEGAAAGTIVDLLARLRAGKLVAQDLDTARNTARMPDDRAQTVEQIASHARALLLDSRLGHSNAGRGSLDDVTSDDIAEMAALVLADALLQVPAASVAHTGFPLTPQYSEGGIAGERYPLQGSDVHAIVIGDQGACAVSPQGARAVRFADCQAVLAYPDGARILIGPDAMQVAVEPTLFEGLTPAVIVALDACLPQHLFIRMPARPESEIPHIQPRPDMAVPPQRGRNVFALLTIGLLGILITLMLGSVALEATLAVGIPHAETGIATTVFDLLPMWFMTAALLAGSVAMFIAAVRRRRELQRDSALGQ